MANPVVVEYVDNQGNVHREVFENVTDSGELVRQLVRHGYYRVKENEKPDPKRKWFAEWRV